MSTSARRGVPPMTPLQSFPDHYPSHAGPSVLDYTTDVSPIRQEGGDFFYSYRIPATDARPAPYGVQRDTYLSKCAAIAPWSVEYDLEIQRPQTPIVGATYGICRVEDPRLAQQPVKQSATQAAEQPAKPKMDMNMARPGSDSSMAGHQTHIARHVAALAVWFWHTPIRPSRRTSPSTSANAAVESTLDIEPFDASCVHVAPTFAKFVTHLLKITQVSHSVVLISLLYLRRLAQNLAPHGRMGPGTELRAFVVSLMLANKYLDDNTYTNKTWSELAGMTLEIINTSEKDFLWGLNYELAVQHTEFVAWSQLLDGFMTPHRNQHGRGTPRTSHHPTGTSSVNSTPFTFRSTPRARSHSPPEYLQPAVAPSSQTISPASQRKRSAGDAFQLELTAADQHAKSMRIPERRGYVDLPGAPTQGDRPVTSSASTLNRAASLNRAVNRVGSDSRRASTSGSAVPSMEYPAPSHVLQYPSQPTDEQYRALMAPQQTAAPPLNVPPEHMVFYTLAADAHPGQDGHRRKGILHHQAPQTYDPSLYAPRFNQAPNPYHPAPTQYQVSPTAAMYPTAPVGPTPMPQQYEPISHLAPIPGQYDYADHQQYGQPAVPLPAQFANAGPPGYQYQPPAQYQQPNFSYAQAQYHPQYQTHAQPTPQGHAQRWSVGSDDLYLAQGQQVSSQPLQSRSEWSSPLPGQGPYGWN